MNPQLIPAVASDQEKDLWTTLGRIEAKVDLIVGLEPRVRALESWRSVLAGAWALAVFLLYLWRG